MLCGRPICSDTQENNVKVCIPVLVVTLLIAVSSYETYIHSCLMYTGVDCMVDVKVS